MIMSGTLNALFVPFKFSSHFIGVSSCMLYIYIWFDHYRLLDNKRLDLGGVRLIFYTMLV